MSLSRTFCFSIVFAAVTCAAAVIGQQSENAKLPASRRAFVTCPMVRDTSTVPCWLAEYDGELYYLGAQGSSASAFYPPQLGHDVLVEGTVSTGPRICGGIPLTPVRVSVITELNRACNTILPAEAEFRPGPSPIAPAPRYPDTTREFTVPYDFDSEYLTLHTTRIVEAAAKIAKTINATRVEIYGRRGATLLSNGKALTESAGIGERRAKTMGENFVGLGIPADRVQMTWQSEPDQPDGMNDPDRRRLTITLRP